MKPLRKLGALLSALARELADQNAYQRHLRRAGCPSSAEEWRRFSDARLREKYSQSKCC